MMPQKQLLHELLKEDQEPFLLKKYISDRLNQLKRPNNSSKTTSSSLQVKKQKQVPINYHQNSNFPINLCKNACFLSFHNTTPDIRKSPLFEFTSSPAKSPSRTAAFILEAALRINQKQSKVKTQDKSNRFELYVGSLFKRLTQRSKNRKRGVIEGNNNNNNNINVKVKDLLRFDSSSTGKKKKEGENDYMVCNYEKGIKDVVVTTGVCSCEVGFTCSSSDVWSESNEDNKSLNTSGQSYESIEEKENTDCVCFDDDSNGVCFCESTFRFVLQRGPSVSSGRRTPEFASPASSPSHHRPEDKECNGADSLNKFQSSEEEEEKEQCSPVSILDPPFDDDDDDVHENQEEGDGFDMDCSYANVQRARQQLLYKLRRFEKLAELDPLELEKRMLDRQEYEYESFNEEDECEEDDSETSCEEKELRETVFEVLCHISVHDKRQVPEELKRIVYDLIMEEERDLNSSEDRDMVIRRVCRKLELWKEVESNTIDMMIEEDFSREECGWKKNEEQIRDLAGELELAIFGFLVEEFSEELVC